MTTASQASKERRALIRAGWEYSRGCPGVEAAGWSKKQDHIDAAISGLKALISGRLEQTIFTRQEAYKKIKVSKL